MKTKWIVLLVLLGIVFVAGISAAAWWFLKESDPLTGDERETLALVAANQEIISDGLEVTKQNLAGFGAEVTPRVDALETFRTIIESPKLYRTFYKVLADTSFLAEDVLSFGGVSDIENNGSTDPAIMESGPIRCMQGDTGAIIIPENKKWSCTLTVEAATERGSMVIRPYFYDITGLSGENYEKGAKMRIDAAGASNQGSFNSTQSISFAFSSQPLNRRVMRIKYEFVDETSPRTIRFFSLSIREM